MPAFFVPLCQNFIYSFNGRTKNDAHLIEFLASTAILDFCKEQRPAHVSLELGLKDEAAGSVTFGSFYDVQREPLFAPLTRFMMMANCLNHKYDYYSSADFNANSEAKYFGGIYHSPFMTDLRQMLDLYKDWLREMKSNNRSLDLYNIDGADKPLDIVTGLQPKKSGLFTIKKDYDFVTESLNKAVKKCVSKENENRFLEMFHLGLTELLKSKFNA